MIEHLWARACECVVASGIYRTSWLALCWHICLEFNKVGGFFCSGIMCCWGCILSADITISEICIALGFMDILQVLIQAAAEKDQCE